MTDFSLHTKLLFGVYGVFLLGTILAYNNWVLSVSLQQFTYLVASTFILFLLSVLMIGADLISASRRSN